MQNTIAGMLTAFGLIGLAMAPAQSSSNELRAKTNEDRVALAISLGSKLQLDTNGLQGSPKTTISKATRNMICDDVLHLTIADIGLSCRTISNARPNTRDVALAN